MKIKIRPSFSFNFSLDDLLSSRAESTSSLRGVLIMQLFIRCSCSFDTAVHSVQLFIRFSFSFDTAVHSMQLFIRYSCSFGAAVHSIQLFIRCSFSFDSAFHSIQLFIRCSCSFHRIRSIQNDQQAIRDSSVIFVAPYWSYRISCLKVQLAPLAQGADSEK